MRRKAGEGGRGLALWAVALVAAPVFLSIVPLSGLAAGPSAPAVQVPMGRIGDHVEYTGTFEARGADPRFRHDVNWTFKVTMDAAAAATVLDRALEARQVVQEAWTWIDDQDHHRSGVANVDLSTRDLIRTDRYGDREEGLEYRNWTVLSFRNTYADIEELGLLSEPAGDVDNASLFRFQGRSFAAGSELVDEVGLLLGCPGAEPEPTDGDRYLGFTVSNIRSSLRLEATPDPAAVAVVDTRSHTGTSRGESFQVVQTRSSVLRSDNPYPVRQEWREEERGRDWWDTLYINLTQTVYRPGTTPILWADAPFSCPPTINSVPERRTGEMRHPSDGTRPPFPYPLEDAKRSVESDATLVGFNLWRQAHPNALFSGAKWDVLPEARLEASRHWTLVYADGARSFGVGATLAEGVAQNWEEGENTLTPFQQVGPGALPTEPVTLTAMAGMYDRIAQGSRAAPTSFWWGVNHIVSPPGRATENPYVPREPQEGILRQLTPAPQGASPTATNYTRLRVNLTSGFVTEFATVDGHKLFPVPAPQGGGGDRPIPGAGPAAPRDAEPLLGATVAGLSLVAIFLLVVFYPLVKFTAGQFVAAVPGYAKITGANVLEHQTRSQLLEQIRSQAGIAETDLFRGSNLGWSTVVYHLRVLERSGQVSSLVQGRHKRFFPRAGVNWSDRDRLGVLQNGRTSLIMDAIRREPGIAQGRLAEIAGVTNQGTVWHLRRLEATGLIRAERRGRRSNYFPAADPPR